MNPVTQGGKDSLQALIAYPDGSSTNATTKQIQYMVEGVDTDFVHTAPLDFSGNAIGPFTVGQVVKIRTLVSNSTGTRTSAVRTITIAEPID